MEAPSDAGLVLPDRWYGLRFHATHARLWNSEALYNIVAAGRRSGKTELAKRHGVLGSIGDVRFHNGLTVYGAPTRDQAKEIFWDDLKALVPDQFVRKINESMLTIELVTGYRIQVFGFDRPQRIEGKPIDRAYIDEFADVKPEAWEAHLFPALGTLGRQGRAWLFGVPEGRNHFWKLHKKAGRGLDPEWAAFHWKSEEILPPDQIARYRASMDARTYQQEFEASFLNFEGRAYYPFDWALHALERVSYDPHLPLHVCFDFNVEPGVAAVVQEQAYKGRRPQIAPVISAVVGEVWIEANSNTEAVCRRLLEDYGDHHGRVFVYGDASGGARGSAKVKGSDWDLIAGSEGVLRKHFGSRLEKRVPRANPPVKRRINAVNRRLLTADGTVAMLMDPERAPHVCEDLDGVTLLKGGAFEIDKRKNEAAGLTHISDALGYYADHQHGVATGAGASVHATI